ncbi:Hypothetical protein PBC10988_28110 [Planctomycetales bacterium 10988]|nr:Hypothetical protein PBC10988_28110 [Planctomycetales bacterium 10988]
MRAKLSLVGGRATKNEIILDNLPIRIGRSRQADLPIAHAQISRDHCEIYELQGALVVRDNGSANGTYINDDAIFEELLKPGDRLKIGPLTFRADYTFSGEYPVLVDDEEDVIDGDLELLANERLGIKASTIQAPASKPAVAPALEAPRLPKPTKSAKSFNGYPSIEPTRTNGNGSAGSGTFLEEPSQPKHVLSALTGNGIFDDDDDDSMDNFWASTNSNSSTVSAAAPDSPSEAKPQSTPGEVIPPDPSYQFSIRLQMMDAGKLALGTPVRVAGITVGRVSQLNWVEIRGEFRVEVRLEVQTSLGGILKEDARLEVRNPYESPIVVVLSPGSSAEALEENGVVMPIDFETMVTGGGNPQTPLRKMAEQNPRKPLPKTPPK